MLANPAFYEVNIIPSSSSVSHNFVIFLGTREEELPYTEEINARDCIWKKKKEDASYI